jgi:hypothetical protein
MLPTGTLANLKMNDKIIIKDKRYLINDISSTLNNGEVKMNLIRELVTIAPDCECIKVTYTLVGGSPVTVEVEISGTLNDKNRYDFLTPNATTIRWDTGVGKWVVTRSGTGGFQATFDEDTECPFGTYTIEDGSIFSAFKVEPCY